MDTELRRELAQRGPEVLKKDVSFLRISHLLISFLTEYQTKAIFLEPFVKMFQKRNFLRSGCSLVQFLYFVVYFDRLFLESGIISNEDKILERGKNFSLVHPVHI